MKIYFDDLDQTTANVLRLSTTEDGRYWYTATGTVIKKTLQEIGVNYEKIDFDTVSESGIYFVDVNGDPKWWCGVCKEDNVPKSNVIDNFPPELIKLIRQKLLRIVIAADREGGTMLSNEFDCFRSITQSMIKNGLPMGSILVIQGNSLIKQQYEKWLSNTLQPRMFEVMYSCHFDKIFFDHRMPQTPVAETSIKNASFDFNSLNRVYRPHRGAHCFYLLTNNILDRGIVSCNQIQEKDHLAALWNGVSQEQYRTLMCDNFPIYIDGNWKDTNAANQYNLSIYENSLMSFITETKFNEDVVFLTEKIFKPLALGHPVILLASCGTLNGLRDLGFRTDWCGIDPSYNDIVDDAERFIATNNILKEWVNLSRDKKVKLIQRSMDTINHNFNLIRQKEFYKDGLRELLNSSKEYFK